MWWLSLSPHSKRVRCSVSGWSGFDRFLLCMCGFPWGSLVFLPLLKSAHVRLIDCSKIEPRSGWECRWLIVLFVSCLSFGPAMD